MAWRVWWRGAGRWRRLTCRSARILGDGWSAAVWEGLMRRGRMGWGGGFCLIRSLMGVGGRGGDVVEFLLSSGFGVEREFFLRGSFGCSLFSYRNGLGVLSFRRRFGLCLSSFFSFETVHRKRRRAHWAFFFGKTMFTRSGATLAFFLLSFLLIFGRRETASVESRGARDSDLGNKGYLRYVYTLKFLACM
jgi:hypothetical protein